MELSVCNAANPAPVELALTNNPVVRGGSGQRRGIAMTIGNPTQLFSAQIGLGYNNTFPAPAATCPESNNYTCVASYGGLYTPPSDVATVTNALNWDGAQGLELSYDGYSYLFYNDEIGVGGFNLPDFPFATLANSTDATDSSIRSFIGMGKNSTFLNSAYDNDIISSHQWSYWPGSVDGSQDGLLVLGGYDEARVDGDFTTFKYDTGRTYFQISNFEWVASGGATTSLMPSGYDWVWALLESNYDYVDIPEDARSAFLSATNYTRINSTTDLYEWDELPAGDLRITTLDGMITEIPASDLFRHPQRYNAAGVLEITNSTTYTGLPSLTAATDTFWMGMPFLAQKVLVADWDHSLFHLANANKATLSSDARKITSLCTPSASSSPTPKPSGNKKPIGAIVGGVVGGVGGLLLIALIAFLVLRRRKKQKAAKEGSAAAAMAENQHPQNQQQHAHQQNSAYPEAVYAHDVKRDSHMSPPPTYMNPGVYQTGAGDPRYGSPPPQMLSDDRQYQQSQQGWTTAATSPQMSASDRTSAYNTMPSPYPVQEAPANQAPVSQAASSPRTGTEHEMSSTQGEGFRATSGPLELPADYDERYGK